MRLAENVAGTRKAATEILQLCFEAKDWKLLNEQILNLSKKRGQLKQVLRFFVVYALREFGFSCSFDSLKRLFRLEALFEFLLRFLPHLTSELCRLSVW